MATTQNTYTGDGSTTDYTLTFPYRAVADVRVSLDDVGTTAFSLINATTLRFNSAPGNGVAIRIYRVTDDSNNKIVFSSGSSIKADDLNDAVNRNLYISQETTNNLANVTAGAVSDGSLTTAKLADASITTAKIAPSAVTTPKITDANVTTVKIADSNVTTAKIADANITTAKIADDAVTEAKVSVKNGFVPTGAVFHFVSNSVPAGYLKCNGDTIPNGSGTVQSVTADFSALYALVGATLPDLRGEFIRGFDDGRGVDSGRGLGTSQGQDYQSHQHGPGTLGTDTHGGHFHGPSSQGGFDNTGNGAPVRPLYEDGPPFNNITYNLTAGAHAHTVNSGLTDLSGNTETRPRNVALLACIKY